MIAYDIASRPPGDLECVLEHLLGRDLYVREVAQAVRACAGVEEGHSLAASEIRLLQAARAMATLGQEQEAAIILSATGSWSGWSGQLDLSSLPSATTRLLEAGLLRAAPSPVLGNGRLVSLELSALPPEEEALELVYVPLIHRLVDAAQSLWQSTSGRGALLVRGWSLHAGCPAPPWLTQAFRDRLAWRAERAGWADVPWLVLADS